MVNRQEIEETIRQWYFRTTRRPRKAILYASVLSFVAMWISWRYMPQEILTKIQSFNSALTLPTLAVLWTSALVFMFLRPTREAAFRSQECMDSGIKSLEGRVETGINVLEKRMDTVTKMFSDALSNKIIPAMDCWNRVGQRIEKVVVDGLFDELKVAIREIKDSAARLEKSAAEGNGEIKKFVADSRPAIEALKRIHSRVDRELGDGFVEDLKSALQSVRELGGMPAGAPAPAPQVRRPKHEEEAPAPPTQQAPMPQIARRPKPAEEAPSPAPTVVLPPEQVPVVETQVADATPAFADMSHPVIIEKLQMQAPAPSPAPAALEVSHEPDFDRVLRVISKKKKAPAGRAS